MNNEEKQFDLIFMDMHMPVMDGLEAAAKILSLNTGVPVVALTANIMANDREIYRKSGMSDCVGKPFTSQELWHCLMKYLHPVCWQAVAQAGDTEMDLQLDIHKTLQTLFIKNNMGKFEEIANALKADDITLAHRLAHTLKSNAGQIGKTALQKVATEVEQHLKDGKNQVSVEQLKRLEMELSAVLREFAPLLGGLPSLEATESNASGEQLDAPAALKLLTKLEPMLASGNAECREFINRLRLVPGSEELIRQIEEYDFEKAMVTLAGLQQKFR